jgi:methylmalonyl-CoA/ethylmalonyl-CoA epimerase
MPDLANSRIGQIAVVCKDMRRAKAFYKDVLGLRHLFDAGPNLSFFNCGGVRLMLTPAERPEDDHLSSILYYQIENIEAVQKDLAAKGVNFVNLPHMIAKMPDHELWLSELRDSEGNALALMEEKR